MNNLGYPVLVLCLFALVCEASGLRNARDIAVVDAKTTTATTITTTKTKKSTRSQLDEELELRTTCFELTGVNREMTDVEATEFNHMYMDLLLPETSDVLEFHVEEQRLAVSGTNDNNNNNDNDTMDTAMARNRRRLRAIDNWKATDVQPPTSSSSLLLRTTMSVFYNKNTAAATADDAEQLSSSVVLPSITNSLLESAAKTIFGDDVISVNKIVCGQQF